MREAAGCDPVVELDTDHCPWASRPAELTDALREIAGSAGRRTAAAPA
jgi:hypothetical protein